MINEKEMIKEPILVKNPITGRFVNVAPLFNTCEQWFEGFAYMAESIDDTIQLLTVYKCEASESDPIRFKNQVGNLFKLRNAIRDMNEYKEDKKC